jgi:SNF2 family DNA or RNA helicase
VLLVSLKAAALGLNLTAANHVVLLDLWWNPTTEEQAIDRAHRIGQARAVHVTRVTIEGAPPGPPPPPGAAALLHVLPGGLVST